MLYVPCVQLFSTPRFEGDHRPLPAIARSLSASWQGTGPEPLDSRLLAAELDIPAHHTDAPDDFLSRLSDDGMYPHYNLDMAVLVRVCPGSLLQMPLFLFGASRIALFSHFLF